MAVNEIYQNGSLVSTGVIPDTAVLLWTFDFLQNFTPTEQASINNSAIEDIITIKNRFYTALQIDPYSSESQLAKTALVAYGILTSGRAEEIFRV